MDSCLPCDCPLTGQGQSWYHWTATCLWWDKCMSTSTQAMPMLPQDFKTIMAYLDGFEAHQNMVETKRLYFKAFATTVFCLWTWYAFAFHVPTLFWPVLLHSNDKLINLQMKHVKALQVSMTGHPYIEFTLAFCKTNKDPHKGKFKNDFSVWYH